MKGRFFVGCLILILMAGSILLWYPTSPNTQTTASSFSQKSITIPILDQDCFTFTARSLEEYLHLEENTLQAITITALPEDNAGTLACNGTPLTPYTQLNRQQLDKLTFSPGEETSAVFTLLPQAADPTPVQIQLCLLSEEYSPPQLEGSSYTTMESVAIGGNLASDDWDGSTLTSELVIPPKKGNVFFYGVSFVYQPFAKANGSDSFTVCARDALGIRSQEVSVSIQIEASDSPGFADMGDSIYQYSARKLAERGILTGEKVGTAQFFHPQQEMSRGEYLAALLAALGEDSQLPVCVNTGLENDSQLPGWIKPYIKKAIDLGIWGEDIFLPNETLTRAQAVVLTCRAANLPEASHITLPLEDSEEIPQWALPSYQSLWDWGMLERYESKARPLSCLDREYAAALLWQLVLYSQSQ